MTQPTNMIQRHAQLRAKQSIAGLSQDERVELSTIETRAQAMFTPHELGEALRASQSMQAQYHQQAHDATVRENAKARAYGLDQVAKSINPTTGHDYATLLRISQGKSYQTPSKRVDSSGYDQAIQGMLGQLGQPNMTRKQLHSLAERYAQAKRLTGQGAADEVVREKFGDHFGNARSLVEAWNRNPQAGDELQFADAMPGHEGETVQPDGSDQIRAQMSVALIEQAKTDDGAREFLSRDDWAEGRLEEDSVEGTMARALQAQESEAVAEDYAQYQPPSLEEV
ncbi:MAG: hypothetical protein AAGI11_04390 [Pseudomonadota bacterium]